jgi:hypothetical protein
VRPLQSTSLMRLMAPALFVAACTSPPGDGEWQGVVRDSAGVIIVVNTAQGVWQGDGGWRLEEELRIGGLEGPSEYQFGQVGTISLDSRGHIYVSDTQAQEVRVFSAEGEYLRTVGGPGQGPGELGRGASVVLIAPGDTLLVPDNGNRRINRFSPEGDVLPSSPLEPEKGRPLRFNLTSHHGMSVQIRPLLRPQGLVRDSLDAIVLVEPSGLLGDTLLRFPSGGLFQGPGIHYFTPEPWWDVTDSLSVVYGLNDELRIGFYDTGGELQRIVGRPEDPTPITERDIRAFFAYLDRAWLDAGVPPTGLAANHDRVHFADFLPAFAAFHLGWQGSLWVQPVRAPGLLSDEEIDRYNFIEDFGASDWEVFDKEGRYLGTVLMPDQFSPRTFLDDRIYGVWRDDLDVQHVLRLRVTEG